MYEICILEDSCAVCQKTLRTWMSSGYAVKIQDWKLNSKDQMVMVIARKKKQ